MIYFNYQLIINNNVSFQEFFEEAIQPVSTCQGRIRWIDPLSSVPVRQNSILNTKKMWAN